jgi:hypothetical protein
MFYRTLFTKFLDNKYIRADPKINIFIHIKNTVVKLDF